MAGGEGRSGSRRRWSVYVVGPLLGVAVIGIAVASIALNTGPEAQKVRWAAAERADVKSRVLAQGRVRARRQVEVGSEITGRVRQVMVEVGDEVKVGDPLFALDDEQLKNSTSQLRVALKAAVAMAARAELMLAEAERGATRDARLSEKGVLAGDAARASRSRVDLSRADLESSRAQSERARLDLLRAQDALKKALVTAPIDGTVVAVNLEVGQIAAPVSGLSGSSMGGGMMGLGSGGDPSATIVIADLSELLARLEVDELDIAQVQIGQPVAITAQGRESERYEAKVTHVGLMGRELGGSVQFPVEAQLAAPGLNPAARSDAGPSIEVPPHDAGPRRVTLRPGMSVSAEIVVKRLDDTLAIPVSAVLEGDDKGKQDRVLLIDDSLVAAATVEEQPITLGPTDDDVVAVLDGLESGDKVVEGPFRTLRALADGDTVVLDEEVKTVSDKRRAEMEKAAKKGAGGEREAP